MQDSRRVVVRDLRFGRACCTPWENCDGCQCSAPPCQSADSPRATRASQKAGWRCHLSHPDNNVFLCLTTHRFSSKERQARVANWETRRSLESVVCSPNRPRGWLAGCHHITLDTRCCVLCSVFCTVVLRILHAVFCTHVRERAGKHPPAPWLCLGVWVEWPPAGMEQSPSGQNGNLEGTSKWSPGGRVCEPCRASD
jgi:hypothetical protein